MELIATKRLRASHIPAIHRDIDYGRDAKEQLGPLWEFALTFDGYKYFGGDEDVVPRLGDFAKSIERAYRKLGHIPQVGEIGMLRACLFYEQRDWCKWGKVMSDLRREDVEYLTALADAIRDRVS